MDRLWAPWRDKYVRQDNKEKKGCVFCKAFRSKKDQKNFVLFRFKHSFSILNIYPYQNGHILISPNKHLNDLDKFNDAELLDVQQHLVYVKKCLKLVLKPQGFNVGLNLGRAAGAGVPGHVHYHIVPRWVGDFNFMPLFSNTKVISQSLESLHERLIDADKKLSRTKRK